MPISPKSRIQLAQATTKITRVRSVGVSTALTNVDVLILPHQFVTLEWSFAEMAKHGQMRSMPTMKTVTSTINILLPHRHFCPIYGPFRTYQVPYVSPMTTSAKQQVYLQEQIRMPLVPSEHLRMPIRHFI